MVASKESGKGKVGQSRSLGRAKSAAPLRVPSPASELPTDYGALLEDLKRRIAAERVRTVLAANAGLVTLYWDVGHAILERQEREGWGARVIDRLSSDLRKAFSDMRGLSPRNLKYMRAFASAWPDRAIVQQLAARIPWYHHCMLMDKVKDPEARRWYVHQTIEQGWSRNVLAMQIESCAHERQGQAITNFPTSLPPTDSDMAAQAFKDPYLFDFLGTADLRREREVETALVDHIQRFLLELGQGFAFVGRQVSLEVGKQDFSIDLLFYHLKLRCFVVVELKAVPFDPAYAGRLNFYLSAVDDLLRHKDDNRTIGLLLCRGKDQMVVEYALRDLNKPIGVAEWETQLVASLPEELKGVLPSIEEIEAELEDSDAR